jgi:hypothetical protein
MFYFVVRHLRWLARIPFFPQLFDALLLAITWALYPTRMAAMEALETEILRLQGVDLRVHRYGGTEFVQSEGRQLGHLHANGLLDALVERIRSGY